MDKNLLKEFAYSNCKERARQMDDSIVRGLERILTETESVLKAFKEGRETAVDCYGRNISAVLFTITENYNVMKCMMDQAEFIETLSAYDD